MARRPALLPTLTANAVLVSLVVGGLEIAIVLGVLWLFPGVASLPAPVLRRCTPAIPIGLAWLLSTEPPARASAGSRLQPLRGRSPYRGGARDRPDCGPGSRRPSPFSPSARSCADLRNWPCSCDLRGLSSTGLSPSLAVVREYGSFGLKAYSSSPHFVPGPAPGPVARRSRSKVLPQRATTQSLWQSPTWSYMLPVVVGTLLFPRLSKIESPREQALFARSVALRVAAVMIPLVIVAGESWQRRDRAAVRCEFAPATPALLWLLPGIAALSVHTIVMNYCAAVGNPRVILIAPIAGLIVNVVLNLALIPSLGIVGASLASTIAYFSCSPSAPCTSCKESGRLTCERWEGGWRTVTIPRCSVREVQRARWEARSRPAGQGRLVSRLSR